MARTQKTLEELLSSVSGNTIKSAILKSICQGEEHIAAAQFLLQDLLVELSKPPAITSLEAIVAEPILSNAFKDYLRSVYCFESWEFWCTAREYRLQFPDVSAESSLKFVLDMLTERLLNNLFHSTGYRIFETYIRTGAELQINISDASVRQLEYLFRPITNEYDVPPDRSPFAVSPKHKKLKALKASETTVRLQQDSFLACEREMLSILEYQSLPAFCESDEYVSVNDLYQTKKAMDKTGYKNIHDFGLLPEEWTVMLTGAEELCFNLGEQIIPQDSFHPYMYFLKQGTARVKVTISGRKGFSFDIEGTKLFGELNVFVGSSRSQYSVRAKTDVIVSRLNMPLVYQFLQLNPVVALRWYCLVGKLFCKFQKAIDLFCNTEGQNTISCGGLFTSVTTSPTHEYSSLTFKTQFPLIGPQIVLCEFKVESSGFLNAGKIMRSTFRPCKPVTIFITGHYICYCSQDSTESRSIPLNQIESGLTTKDTKGLTLTIQTKDKRKASLKFQNKKSREAFENLLATIIISKDPLLLSGQKSNQYQPRLEREDWVTVQETAVRCAIEDDSFANSIFVSVYTTGDVIVRQNQRCYRVFHILQGSCTVQREYIDGKDLRKDILYEYGMEELAGEIELFSPAAPHYSVIANEETVKVLELNQDFIQNILFAENPQVVIRLYDQMCRGMANRISYSLRRNIQF